MARPTAIIRPYARLTTPLAEICVGAVVWNISCAGPFELAFGSVQPSRTARTRPLRRVTTLRRGPPNLPFMRGAANQPSRGRLCGQTGLMQLQQRMLCRQTTLTARSSRLRGNTAKLLRRSRSRQDPPIVSPSIAEAMPLGFRSMRACMGRGGIAGWGPRTTSSSRPMSLTASAKAVPQSGSRGGCASGSSLACARRLD